MKVLYIDIETAPATAYVWGMFKQNIGVKQLIRPPRVMCFAAKWRGKKKMEFSAEWGAGQLEMIEHAWRLLDEADVVVHYNGITFDVPHLNGEFATRSIIPPAPFQQLDMLRVIRKNFRFISNKLAHTSVQFGFDGKIDTDFDLWTGCMDGDPAAQRKMMRYNKQDVVLLEELHTELLPWCGNQANMQMFEGGVIDGCPKCGSLRLQRNGFAYTTVSKFQRWRCMDCGGSARSGRRIMGADLRAAL
jgi:hypothetical protein